MLAIFDAKIKILMGESECLPSKRQKQTCAIKKAKSGSSAYPSIASSYQNMSNLKPSEAI
jgi:hypothetical protein